MMLGRFLLWLVWQLFVEMIAWAIGWVMCKTATFGTWPKAKLDECETRNWVEVAICRNGRARHNFYARLSGCVLNAVNVDSFYPGCALASVVCSSNPETSNPFESPPLKLEQCHANELLPRHHLFHGLY